MKVKASLSSRSYSLGPWAQPRVALSADQCSFYRHLDELLSESVEIGFALNAFGQFGDVSFELLFEVFIVFYTHYFILKEVSHSHFFL